MANCVRAPAALLLLLAAMTFAHGTAVKLSDIPKIEPYNGLPLVDMSTKQRGSSVIVTLASGHAVKGQTLDSLILSVANADGSDCKTSLLDKEDCTEPDFQCHYETTSTMMKTLCPNLAVSVSGGVGTFVTEVTLTYTNPAELDPFGNPVLEGATHILRASTVMVTTTTLVAALEEGSDANVAVSFSALQGSDVKQAPRGSDATVDILFAAKTPPSMESLELVTVTSSNPDLRMSIITHTAASFCQSGKGCTHKFQLLYSTLAEVCSLSASARLLLRAPDGTDFYATVTYAHPTTSTAACLMGEAQLVPAKGYMKLLGDDTAYVTSPSGSASLVFETGVVNKHTDVPIAASPESVRFGLYNAATDTCGPTTPTLQEIFNPTDGIADAAKSFITVDASSSLKTTVTVTMTYANVQAIAAFGVAGSDTTEKDRFSSEYQADVCMVSTLVITSFDTDGRRLRQLVQSTSRGSASSSASGGLSMVFNAGDTKVVDDSTHVVLELDVFDEDVLSSRQDHTVISAAVREALKTHFAEHVAAVAVHSLTATSTSTLRRLLSGSKAAGSISVDASLLLHGTPEEIKTAKSAIHTSIEADSSTLTSAVDTNLSARGVNSLSTSSVTVADQEPDTDKPESGCGSWFECNKAVAIGVGGAAGFVAIIALIAIVKRKRN